MRSRRLGRDLEVSAVGYGCMGLTSGYGRGLGRDEAIRVIRHGVELGVTFFDTADGYGPWENEILVGEALAPFAGEVTIATKFNHVFDDHGGRQGQIARPEQVRAAAEASLRRLGVDAFDLYYLHRVNPADRGHGGGGRRARHGRLPASQSSPTLSGWLIAVARRWGRER